MAVRTIEQSIDVEAPRERVWDVLLDDTSYRQWAAVFSAGSRAETDWQQGSSVRFVDDSGDGLLGRIVVSERPAQVSIEYDGAVVDGREDHESEMARAVQGTHESYRLSERDGGTHLDVRCDMDEQYYDEMDRAWVRALAKVKALAEGQ